MKPTPALYIARYLVNGQIPKNGRGPTKQPFPFNGCLPLSLRNRVSNRKSQTGGAPCLYEITSLLACLKENDFNDKKCFEFAETLNRCEANHKSVTKIQTEQAREGVLVPGAKTFSNSQLNKLLAKYPQPEIKR